MRSEYDAAKRVSVYHLSAGESVSEGIIAAVSDVTDHAPIPNANGHDAEGAMEPLYHAIDPDALDTLFEQSESGARIDVSFQYMGYEITVSEDRQITIEGPELVVGDS